jgi:hypothetical protein
MKYQNKMNTLKIKAYDLQSTIPQNRPVAGLVKKCLPVLLIAILSLHTYTAQAQRGRSNQAVREEMMNRLQEAKWGFIIYKLNLDEARSNKLLPVYKAYEAEKRAIVSTGAGQFRGNKENMDDEQAAAFMDTRLENAKKLLDLKEKYKPQFLAILSPKELLLLQNAEQDFAMKVMMERQKRRAERNH